MCLAFFGFLCCGEFTVPEGQECDASVHLMVNNTAMDPGLYPAGISVRIKASKTDPYRQGAVSLQLIAVQHLQMKLMYAVANLIFTNTVHP